MYCNTVRVNISTTGPVAIVADVSSAKKSAFLILSTTTHYLLTNCNTFSGTSVAHRCFVFVPKKEIFCSLHERQFPKNFGKLRAFLKFKILISMVDDSG